MCRSCGNTRRIEVGDTFLLTKVGVEPKGIIGCGYVLSAPYELPHWDSEKAARGMSALRTDLLFKALAETPIVPLDYLEDHHPGYTWTPQVGDLSVPFDIAEDLLAMIQGNASHNFEACNKQDIKLYAEGRIKSIKSKAYDRSRGAR